MEDSGAPIAYHVLERGVPVRCSAGEPVGTVDHVVAAEREDIFHGIVIETPDGKRFVAADEVASLHEHGVELAIDSERAGQLPEPHGAPRAFHLDAKRHSGTWGELIDRLTGRGGWRG